MTSPAPSPRIETVTGAAMLPHLADCARLRCAVFREWPYLYAGAPDAEARYLATYAESPGAALLLAWDADRIVGVATCQPMTEASAPVQAAFHRRGQDPAAWCYFGESVLLPEYRGRGVGLGFFAGREAHARALGLGGAAFCAVVRNGNDPRKPRDYTPLDSFWRKRGYTPAPGISCVFNWREVDDDRETPHSLGFWLKSLDGRPLP